MLECRCPLPWRLSLTTSHLGIHGSEYYSNCWIEGAVDFVSFLAILRVQYASFSDRMTFQIFGMKASCVWSFTHAMMLLIPRVPQHLDHELNHQCPSLQLHYDRCLHSPVLTASVIDGVQRVDHRIRQVQRRRQLVCDQQLDSPGHGDYLPWTPVARICQGPLPEHGASQQRVSRHLPLCYTLAQKHRIRNQPAGWSPWNAT